MGDVNKAIIVGHLGGDPKVRTAPGATCVAELSIATTKTRRDKVTQEKKQSTEWHRVVAPPVDDEVPF